MNYLVTGNDSYMRRSAVEDLLKTLMPKGSRDMDFAAYDAEIDPIEQVIASVQTVPFLLPKRIIVLKRVEKLKQASLESLSTYLKKPFSQSSLVLVAAQVKKTKIWHSILKNVKLKNVDKPKNFNSTLWIKNEFEKNSKTISKDALMKFKEMSFGQDLLYLKTEVEKTSVYVGQRQNITKEDVEIIAGQTYEEDVFSLVNDIAKGDSRAALKKLEKLFVKKIKPHELIGLLGWHFRKLLSSRRRGAVPAKKIHKSLSLLLQTDLRLKTTSIDPIVSLETTILALCSR